MKKIVVLFLSVVCLSALVCIPAACKEKEPSHNTDNSVDTFDGAFSAQSYDTDKAAVEGFLSTEISGDAVKAELVDFKEKGKLGSNELNALDKEFLDEGDEIVSGKSVEVTYKREKKTAVASLAEEEEPDLVFTVYIIEISPKGVTVHEFRYYVPRAKDGDVLTKSYYEDLLDSAKYVNCTQIYTNFMKMTVPDMASSTPDNIKTKVEEMNSAYTIMVADNKASLEMTMPDLTLYDPEDPSAKLTYNHLWGYFENGTEFNVWASTDGVSYEKAATNPFEQYGITDIKSFAVMCLPKLDYSYYEKTDYGFKIQDDFINEYASKALIQALPMADPTVKAELRIYVTDGRVTRMEASVSVSMSMDGALVLGTSTEEKLEFKNFGTTSVTKPSGVAA